jgi:hypothetical protein
LDIFSQYFGSPVAKPRSGQFDGNSVQTVSGGLQCGLRLQNRGLKAQPEGFVERFGLEEASMRFKLFSLVAAGALLLAFGPAVKADSFTLSGPAYYSGTGFGTVYNLLTLQQNGGETGAVAPTTASNLTTLGTNFGGCSVHSGIDLCGDATNTSEVITAADLSAIGITSSGGFGLLYNASQEGGDPNTFLSANPAFTVYFYDSNGNLLFSASFAGTSSPFPPIGGNGQGQTGYLFTMSGSDFGTYFNSIAYVGMSGTVGNSNDGPDDWHVVNASQGTPVPEPGSLMLFGTGLLGMAGFMKRKLLG